MDESTEGSAVERLFEWLKQKHPDADNEALLDKALANVDAFAQRSGESPEALRTLRAALQSAANRLEFPSRLLRHGSEPVRAADIRVGAVYYDVGYYGSDCLFPCVLPYVFAGFGLSGDGDDLAYFQDINSYAAGVRFGDDRSEEDAEFLCQSHQIGSMYTFDVALEALMKVSLDRDRVMERSYRKL